MPHTISPAVRLAARALRSCWRDLLATDACLRLLVLAVATPLLGGTLRAFVAWSGGPLLADQDLLRFALSPAGLLVLLLALSLRLAILFLQHACLLWIASGAASGAASGERRRVVAALRFGAGHGGAVLRLAARIVVRLLLLAAPFLAAAAAVAWALLSEFDVNYYLKERPPAFWLAAAICGALLLAMGALLLARLAGWIFALPLLLFEGVAPSQALAASAARARGRRVEIVRVLVVWGGATLLANFLVLLAIRALGSVLVPAVGGSLRVALPALGALVVLAALASFLLAALSTSALATLVFALHRGDGAADHAPADRDDPAPAHGHALPRVTRWTRGRLLAGLGLFAAASAAGAWLLLRDLRAVDEVAVVGHRGAAAGAPENTLAAVRLAIAERADWAEIDVQETSDGAVVVHHDADFMRVAGSPRKVWEATLAQVQELDVGIRLGERFRGEKVATLEELLATAKGRIRVVIEFKHYGHAVRLEERVVEIVERAGMADEVAVMSLSAESVARARALRPRWRAGLLAAKAIGRVDGLDADFVAVSQATAKRPFLRAAAAAHKQVWVWTLNDALSLSRAMSAGADGVITDRPGLARAVLAERALMSSAERLLVEAAFALGIAPEREVEQ